MSDSVTKYFEMVEDGTIQPEKPNNKVLGLTDEQRAQGYEILIKYDEKAIKFAFNELMFGSKK